MSIYVCKCICVIYTEAINMYFTHRKENRPIIKTWFKIILSLDWGRQKMPVVISKVLSFALGYGFTVRQINMEQQGACDLNIRLWLIQFLVLGLKEKNNSEEPQ